jgi:hypothetical protein
MGLCLGMMILSTLLFSDHVQHPRGLSRRGTPHTVVSRSPCSQNLAEQYFTLCLPTLLSATAGQAVQLALVKRRIISCMSNSFFRTASSPHILPTNPSVNLRTHMLKKSYKCAFCDNRFGNKNEATRHQKSLHLRRQSWFCVAISGYEAAFALLTSQTSNKPLNDTCDYCGEEFSNFPRDLNARMEHVTNIHKFGECNQTKKFFRADHFRQHLNHSHAGTSGKWSSILENACMKDEPPSSTPLAMEGLQPRS